MNSLEQPGVTRTISGKLIDLKDPKAGDITIADVAWGLGRIVRYGGHIHTDWTVAHHSLVMSYLVDESNAMEALLHDAAEAYMGDIITPIKTMFPEVAKFEDGLLSKIMEELHPHFDEGEYELCRDVKDADKLLYDWECWSFGRPGTYHQVVQDASDKVMEHLADDYMLTVGAPWIAFLRRYFELANLERDIDWEEYLATAMKVWYPQYDAVEEGTEEKQSA